MAIVFPSNRAKEDYPVGVAVPVGDDNLAGGTESWALQPCGCRALCLAYTPGEWQHHKSEVDTLRRNRESG